MRRHWLFALPAVGLVVVLIGGAVAGMARTSLQPDVRGGLSTAAWETVLTDSRFHESVLFTVAVAVVTTAVSVVVAVPIAGWLRSLRVARTLFGLPVVVPHLLVAALAVLWLGPGGLADRLLDPLPVQVVRSPTGAGIVLVYLVKEVPFLALLAVASWTDRVDGLVEEAALAGAGPQRRLWQVVVPALRTPLVFGAVMVAAFVLGSFEVPLLTGPNSPPTLAVHALDATRLSGIAGRAEAAATLLVATLLAALLAAAVLPLARRDRRD